MKLYYIANARIPTEKAHGIQIMKTCEAFANAGQEVTLLLPWRFNSIKENPFDYYGVERNFKIKKIFSLDTVFLGRIGFLIQLISFSLSALVYALFIKKDIIYSRDELVCWFFLFVNKKVYWEAHTNRYNFFARSVLRRARGIVTISNGLKEFFVAQGISKDRIYVAPDAVDLDEFAISMTKEKAREKLNLPLDKKIVLYTGHLYPWKGAHVLRDASNYLSKDIVVVFVGGTNEDILWFKNKADKLQNIIVTGHRLYKDIPIYLKAADVLVLPNSGKTDISRRYTSPMKLFEYMASGKPIIASDLQSIREILNESNSYLIESDNQKLLARAIEEVFSKDTTKVTERAYEDVKEYTWIKRAESILTFITRSG